ncbi:hypothetical protein [Aminobacter sp. AP02]|uniref:hypothetical protein n=1 Tax=Aminobacter sp. AP02 TaxID=2135737 RepID=UPI001305031B|nr:hypothetical protein [Aminobacter sp. AP02]
MACADLCSAWVKSVDGILRFVVVDAALKACSTCHELAIRLGNYEVARALGAARGANG